MATYFVASGGSNTAPYETWAKAATSLQTALTAASTDGDIVVIQHDAVPTTDSALAGNTTYTFAANVSLLSASNDGGSAYTLTPMGTAGTNFIGNSGEHRGIIFAGARRCLIYGITLRTGGTGINQYSFSNTNGAFTELDSCHFWLGTIDNNADVCVRTGVTNATQRTNTVFKNCTFRFGAALHTIQPRRTSQYIGCSVSTSGTAPTSLFQGAEGSISVECYDCDWSFVTGNLVRNLATRGGSSFTFANCKLGEGVTLFAPVTLESAGEKVLILNCSSTTNYYEFAYITGTGTLTAVTSPYAATGALFNGTNQVTWKIVTTSGASYIDPFVSPWIDLYHDGTVAITPYLECIKDDSAGAVFQNDEVWSEWGYQGAAGTLGTNVNDRRGITAAAADQTTSSATWTGATGTPGKFKLSPTAAITPASIGMLRARVCVGEPSATVFVDPYIRIT